MQEEAAMNRSTFHLISLVTAISFFFLLTSCQTTTVNLNPDTNDYDVNLNVNDYKPKLSGINPAYKGKAMCLSNIRNDARNTSNFSYYSKDLKVRYNLSNKGNTFMQLVPSFFWYAYQKAFEHAGITTIEHCSGNIPELWIIFQSFDDEELQLKITLLENRKTIFEKNLKVTMSPASGRHPATLQTRAYEMIDLTINTILNDSCFQAAFL